MRLLNVATKKLEEYFGDDIPPYAILSHTWGTNEVTFKDIKKTGYISGSSKVDGCFRVAMFRLYCDHYHQTLGSSSAKHTCTVEGS
jgi:hypothetical protein